MNNGFTLIEVLLYLALFAIIIGGAMVGVYQIIESTTDIEAKVMAIEEGTFVQRKLDWALVGSSVVAGSTDSDTLTLNKPGGNLVFEFDGTNVTLDGMLLNNTYVHVTDPNIVFDSGENRVDISFDVNDQSFTQTKFLY